MIRADVERTEAAVRVAGDVELVILNLVVAYKAVEELGETEKTWIKVLNVGGIPAFIILLGLGWYLIRATASRRYESAYLRRSAEGTAR